MFHTNVEYVELIGSETREISTNGTRITRFALVDWNDARQFCNDMCGGVTVAGVTQSYTQPDYHPVYTHCRVRSCQVEGLGQSGLDQYGVITYPKARVTINYDDQVSQNSGESNQVVFITEERNYSAETITIKERGSFYFTKFPYQFIDMLAYNGIVPPRGRIEFGKGTFSGLLNQGLRGRRGTVPAHVLNADDIDTNDPVPGAYAKILNPLAEISINVHFWKDYPEDDIAIQLLIGCVNLDYYKPLLCTYPPFTLLLSAVNRARQFTSDGLTSWQIQFKFAFKKTGWNSVYRGATRKRDPNTGVPGAAVTRDWPAGFYPIMTKDSNGNLVFPFTPVPFNSFLLPSGWTKTDHVPDPPGIPF